MNQLAVTNGGEGHPLRDCDGCDRWFVIRGEEAAAVAADVLKHDVTTVKGGGGGALIFLFPEKKKTK